MKATVTAHRDYTIARIDDRVYGAFLEHLGRAIYTGIYEPGHATADANGMRGDVAQLVRDSKSPLFAIRAGTSCRPTTGRTASVPVNCGQPASTSHGTPRKAMQ